ncbi:potassium transporter TrkG [Lyngbya aestuarii]|uniref:potassium transporter TrkG n=1 Tax=Lyngbya aestuarii TaxID=118322 RepID=UPI00403E34F5
MKPYIKTILRDLGLFLHVPGLMALVSLPVCLWWGEYYAIRPFVLTALTSLGAGQLLYSKWRGASMARTRYSMFTVALAWAIIPIVGAMPFMLIASDLAMDPVTPVSVLEFQNSWNALFESFSGFTSTGLSMALHASELPHSLQWWRSFMEWIGGVGVIVLVLSLLQPSTDPEQLYSAEGRDQKIALTVTATVRRIWWIYLLYTVASIILLRVVGMPWWEAINHGLTGISTGGFSIRDDSIGAYAPSIQIAVIVIMIAGAISFPIHYQLLRHGRLRSLWGDSQHRALWILLVLGTLLLLLANYSFKESFLWLESAFQWASALGTCGFGVVDLSRWNASAKLLLTLAMIVGGTAGSTVGGLKLNRVVSLYKAVLWRFQRLSLKPHQMMRYELNGEVVTEAEANRRIEAAAVLALLWLGMLLLGVFVLLQISLPKYTLSDIIFEAASALGSVGLSTGISHPNLPWIGKLTLIIMMWMGRLEIIPVLLLLSSTLRACTTRPRRSDWPK